VRIAVCGGVYSNPYALRAFVTDARRRGAERLYCLGDLGGYGAEPDAIWPLLTQYDVECIAGNYDVAIAQAGPNCGCGYRDPRDNEYAQIMYDFTLRHTSRDFAAWMAGLATERRESLGGFAVHFVHGSPAGLNDFWWESLPARAHAERIACSGADVIFCTHSGLPWTRQIDGRLAVNVGVIGRPPNDGGLDVRYALADLSGGIARARIISLPYDWRAQARSMRGGGLPEAFVRTAETGWWTTCLEVLPAAERSWGYYHVYDSSVPTLLEAAGLPASEWPDGDPDIPVRTLFGSPFLPNRLWLTDPVLVSDAFRGQANAAGITHIMTTNNASVPQLRPLVGPAELPVPELTLSRAGWHWHPALLDAAPFLPVGPDGAAAPVRAARQTVVQEVLQHLYRVGLLAPPCYCVPS
jgi:Calcineurin-like phosphoesterase superfamily domain